MIATRTTRDDELRRVPLLSSEPETLDSTNGTITGLTVDKTNAYWLRGAGFISKTWTLYAGNKAKFEGKALAKDVSVGNPPHLVLAGGKLYWVGENDELLTVRTAEGQAKVLGTVEGVVAMRGNEEGCSCFAIQGRCVAKSSSCRRELTTCPKRVFWPRWATR